jgi:hypothetical protein
MERAAATKERITLEELVATERANFQQLLTKPPPSLVDKGGHTLLFRGGRRGFDPRQLRRTIRAFFPP